jgi:hypothetical protein
MKYPLFDMTKNSSTFSRHVDNCAYVANVWQSRHNETKAEPGSVPDAAFDRAKVPQ